MEQMSIAVLMTCHNRKLKTLATLESLFKQILTSEIALNTYLVDDGSTDGTAEAVQQTYPQVKIFSGDGNLFWNGGMRGAFSEAMKHDPDYYLWLNDDTVIYSKTISVLLETSHKLSEKGETKAIIGGSTCDPETGQTTYGGVVRNNALHPFRYGILEPTKDPQMCDTMHGNCVLIPRSVVQIVGNLDPAFVHYIGDWDYGLRARQKGCTVWIAPGYLGTCSLNPQVTKMAAENLSEGLDKMSKPKGLSFKDTTLQPAQEWKVFAQRHGGLLWPIYWLLPYRRLVWLSVLSKLGLTKNKTQGE
ncbi:MULTISPECIES: glycosyltransferase family 2 protein [unclassified Microcoleus]|uniref:glycosyltransferase family 2 protein n=1 Tax=unclassified Microcoleus TaxID=2642155 RepID=UPI002FD1E163